MQSAATYYNGIISWTPSQCGVVHASDETVKPEDARAFNPASVSYYTDQIGSMVPGIVLGSICAVGFILMLVWICVRFCRRRQIAAAEAPPDAQQFLASGGGDPSAGASTGAALEFPHRNHRRRRRAADLLTFAMLLTGLATLGVSAWGLAESIMSTDTTVSDFWVVIQDIHGIVYDGRAELAHLSYELDGLGRSASTLVNQTATLVAPLETILTSRGLPAGTARKLLDDAATLPQEYLGNIAGAINDTAVPVFDDLVDAVDSVLKYEPKTMTFQDKWRYIVLAVFFGLLLLSVLIAIPVCFYMRFGRWAAFAVAVVWFMNMLCMLGGLGLLSGAKAVSVDACLYAETFMYAKAAELSNPTTRKLVNETLNYYFGVTNLTAVAERDVVDRYITNSTLGDIVERFDPDLAGAVLEKVSDLNITAALHKLKDVERVLVSLGSDLGGIAPVAEQLGIPPATVAAAWDFVASTAGVLNSSLAVMETLRRAGVVPTYHSFKTYLCCNMGGSVEDVWVAWTVTGVVALFYCLLATTRVVWQTIYPTDKGVASFRLHKQVETLPLEGSGSDGPAGALKSTGPSLSLSKSQSDSVDCHATAGGTSTSGDAIPARTAADTAAVRAPLL